MSAFEVWCGRSRISPRGGLPTVLEARRYAREVAEARVRNFGAQPPREFVIVQGGHAVETITR